MKKPIKARLYDNHEDAVCINLGSPLEFHLPFEALKTYYNKGISRPAHRIGKDDKPENLGHEMYSIVDMFGPGDLKGTWLEDGVWIGPNHYRCQEVPGSHIKGKCDQEFIFTAVECINGSRPFASSVRNFTMPTEFRPPVNDQMIVARVHGWGPKIAANIPKMEKSLHELPDSQLIYYVGSGPSLRHNWQELKRVDRSKCQIWAMNESFTFLMENGIVPDVTFCIDATSPKRWWEKLDCSGTILVSTGFVNPAILDYNWKDRLWFGVNSDGYYYNLMRKARPHLLELDCSYGVGCAAIEAAWHKKARTVVLVGSDFAYEPVEDGVYTHCKNFIPREKWQGFVTEHPHSPVLGMDGKWTVSFSGLTTEAGGFFGCCEAMWEKGVRIINASEKGCLRANPSCEYLAKHQEKIGSPVMTQEKLSDVVTRLEGTKGFWYGKLAP
jgi:hypothetical protein